MQHHVNIYSQPNSLGETPTYMRFFFPPFLRRNWVAAALSDGRVPCLALYKPCPTASAPSLPNDSKPATSDLPPPPAQAPARRDTEGKVLGSSPEAAAAERSCPSDPDPTRAFAIPAPQLKEAI